MAGDLKRLGIWRDFLRNLPMYDKNARLRFDISFYANGKFTGQGFDALSKCTTAGCALGWGLCIPEFIELGWHQGNYSTPLIGNKVAHNAAAGFFQIEGDKVNEIVMDSSYTASPVTPQMVADRIQEIMDE